MRRFKQSNKNMKFAKNVLKIAKKYGAKEFNTYSGYYIFSFSKHSVIHFLLPNNYKVGIWLDSKDIFAEHLANVDKFKPSRTEFADKFENIEDIKMFIDNVSKVRDDECDTELKESIEHRLEFDRTMYQYIIGLKGVKDIIIKRDDSSFTYNDMYSMDICIKANNEEEAIKIGNRIQEEIENFYKNESKKYSAWIVEGNIGIFKTIIWMSDCRNIHWFYEE